MSIDSPAPTPARLMPPRKWLGPAGGWLILAAFLVLWLVNLLFDFFVDHDVQLSPNSLVLGGFGMTSALIYTLAYRLRPTDGITPLRLVLAFLLGGLFSTELAVFAEIGIGAIPIGSAADQNVLVRGLAGVIEEACKLLAVVIAARGLTVRNARTGLFMGGAVGLGFAAYEDMRYAVEALGSATGAVDQLRQVLEVTVVRDVIGPLEHPILSALLAAALFGATRNGRFRITPIVFGAYLVLAAVHGLIDTVPILIDSAWSGGADVASGAVGTIVDVVIAVGLGVTWLIYTRRLKRTGPGQSAGASERSGDGPVEPVEPLG